MAKSTSRFTTRLLVLAVVSLCVSVPSTAYAIQTTAPVAEALSARPASIDFGKRKINTTYYKQTRITNNFSIPVKVLVTGGLPDDFGFGLLPGSTCPALDATVMAPGESCVAVVRFTPSEGFLGWNAVGSLEATASDPATNAVLSTLSIPVTGTAVRRTAACPRLR
jgi:hypothetical protein